MSLWKTRKTPGDLAQLGKSRSFNDNLTVLIPLENLSEYPELLGDYTNLKDVNLRRSFEAEHGLFLAESNEVIMRVLRAGYRPRSLLVTPHWLEILAPVLASTSCTHGDPEGGPIPVFVATEAVLEQLVGFHLHRGAIASMERPALPDPAAILAQSRRVLVLEDLVDHTNVGAAVRSAAACNYDAILVTPSCADPLYRRAVRVSMGTIFQVPWTRLKRWPDADLFHAAGFELAALALRDDAVDLRDYARKLAGDSTRKVALVAGAERDGLKRSTVAKADYVVRIEMAHGVDSLNVAGACAVACWAIAQ
ncbi:RNA methyltransferase, TrmH family [Mobiluncus mulieris 28-1]|uniref:TrmH family RNA methyltransferase n=1 Tax=Mobiluncus mulieris TaxID=2052 RepID=UPI0001BE7B44|nr:RNA methyltransferase [Mobiluncus mulieris]EEZ91083.1 RNA methyltransferase, TrmH family [Mobiluncus mulieris 28-1]